MDASSKPPVCETADGRCALRAKRRSFCQVCMFRHGCWYLAMERGTLHPVAPVPIAESA